jgi:hypothetical protein
MIVMLIPLGDRFWKITSIKYGLFGKRGGIIKSAVPIWPGKDPNERGMIHGGNSCEYQEFPVNSSVPTAS